MIRAYLGRNSDLFLVVGVLAILLVLFAPIPPFLLDLLILSNFALGLTILLLTLYVSRPVEFSTFPSLLLVATLFRLALNVSATRLILTGANAGEVIGAIGSFAVSGNFVIGLVVFLILVVVQYIVVTAGAQRVSEVAARFVLDSMPGQQMSIDADLNMGLIDQAEAKKRRKDVEKEASFYGAMDGASKFVKGDAVAGIIILLINILAGWAVGVAQMGMDWLQALETFTLLTIGDGIVTQIPALVISVATGIIVTRSSSDRRLSTEVFSQLGSVAKIPMIVLAALLVLLLLPGMPKWPMFALVPLGVAMLVIRRNRATESAALDDDVAEPAALSLVGMPKPIEVRFGALLGSQWRSLQPVLIERVAALRDAQEKQTGLRLPPVAFTDNVQLPAQDYEIVLLGARHAQATLYPDQSLAIGTSTTAKLPGIETRDPAFGLPAVWISAEAFDTARDAGLTLVDPMTVMLTHLGELLRAEAALLFSRAETVRLLDGVRERQPGLIEELVPAIMTVSDVHRVLQNLLSESVSIRAIDQIAEVLVDVGRHSKDPGELTELVRQRVGNGICHDLRGQHDQLSVLSLDPRIEGQIADSVRRGGTGTGLIIEPKLAEHLVRSLASLADDMVRQSIAPVLLCGPEIRRQLRAFTRRSVPRLAVISVNEIPHSINLNSFGVVAET